MKENKKIIKFPEYVDSNNGELEEYSDDSYFEADSNLYYSENWKELIKLRENRCKQKPDDPSTLWRLGEAYLLNAEYEKALNYLKNLHKKYPEYVDIQYSILNCLFALDKNDDDFEWEEKPSILRMSKDVISKCYNFLLNKRKPRSLFEVYEIFLTTSDYIMFEEEDLLAELKKDKRFEITGDFKYAFTLKIK